MDVRVHVPVRRLILAYSTTLLEYQASTVMLQFCIIYLLDLYR